jgi:hypothetical protein
MTSTGNPFIRLCTIGIGLWGNAVSSKAIGLGWHDPDDAHPPSSAVIATPINACANLTRSSPDSLME